MSENVSNIFEKNIKDLLSLLKREKKEKLEQDNEKFQENIKKLELKGFSNNDKRFQKNLKNILTNNEKLASLPEEYEKANWFRKKVEFLQKTKFYPATFIPKAIHSKNGMMLPLWLRPNDICFRREIGTHSLPLSSFEEDFTGGTSGQLPDIDEVFKFYRLEIASKPLWEWLEEKNDDLLKVFSEERKEAESVISVFLEYYRNAFSQKPSASKYSKQIYWLVGNNALEDKDYLLYQPLFSMTLEKYISEKIQNHEEWRRKKGNVQQIRLRNKFIKLNLAYRPLGGGNAQNVSKLTASIGNNKLFSCAPPQLKQRKKGVGSGKKDFIALWVKKSENNRKEKENLVSLISRKEAPFSLSEDARDYALRHRQKNIRRAMQNLAEDIWRWAFEEVVLNVPGWSEKYKLPSCQMFWLDPIRAEYDEAFKQERENFEWVLDLTASFIREVRDLLKAQRVTESVLGKNFSDSLRKAFVKASNWDIDLRSFAQEGAFEEQEFV